MSLDHLHTHSRCSRSQQILSKPLQNREKEAAIQFCQRTKRPRHPATGPSQSQPISTSTHQLLCTPTIPAAKRLPLWRIHHIIKEREGRKVPKAVEPKRRLRPGSNSTWNSDSIKTFLGNSKSELQQCKQVSGKKTAIATRISLREEEFVRKGSDPRHRDLRAELEPAPTIPAASGVQLLFPQAKTQAATDKPTQPVSTSLFLLPLSALLFSPLPFFQLSHISCRLDHEKRCRNFWKPQPSGTWTTRLFGRERHQASKFAACLDSNKLRGEWTPSQST